MGSTPEQIFTQLVAVGNTVSVEVEQNIEHSFQLKLANKVTNVIVGIVGSLDGTNFFEVPLVNTAVAGCAITTNRCTITVDGTYVLKCQGKYKELRFDFISEAGGATATLDVRYFGGK